MSRGREAWQELAASYYAFDGFPELMFVFFFVGPFSEARLTGSFREVIIIIIIIIVSSLCPVEKEPSENEKI